MMQKLGILTYVYYCGDCFCLPAEGGEFSAASRRFILALSLAPHVSVSVDISTVCLYLNTVLQKNPPDVYPFFIDLTF